MAKTTSKKFNYNVRIYVLIGLVILSLIVTGMRLLQFQIVEGEKNLLLAQKNAYTNITIKAARGEIVDQKGVVLATNKAVFSVVLDYSFLKKGTENEVIYKLLKVLENNDETWIDNLPITPQAPYEFLANSEKEVARLKSKLRLNDYATAQNCLDKLIKDNDINDYTPEYQRKIAGIRYEMVQKDFSRYNRYTVTQDIDAKTVAILKELSDELVGVTVVEEAMRQYVSGDVAAHLIGGVGPIYADDKDYYLNKKYSLGDTVGKGGIEEALEDELRGKNGVMSVTHSPKGKVLSVEQTTQPIPGNTVMLSLDYEFQKKVQQILSEHIASYNSTRKAGTRECKAGSVVVLDTKTGGVLASVSYPYYDINATPAQLSALEGNPQYSRDYQATYRPGSTFKTALAAGGLTENIISANSTFNCTGKYMYFAPSYTPSCLRDHHSGATNIFTALQYSCNIYFFELGRIMGIDKMNHYAGMLGLAQKTGFELDYDKKTGEYQQRGNLSSPEYSQSKGQIWYPGNIAQAAIGQLDTAVTPLQMALQAATLANKGTRYNVHLTKSILSYDQKTVLKNIEPQIASQFELTQANYDIISKGMTMGGKTIGHPYQLTDLGYDVAVKTGTPQTGTDRFNNGFLSFAPVSNPEISISCILEDGGNASRMIRPILLAYEDSKKPPEPQPPVSTPSSDAPQTSSTDVNSQPPAQIPPRTDTSSPTSSQTVTE
ncbi:MAG: penicillin-binding transpeptidase domain-containing protein [Oscillospiraceae bacterium]